MSTTYTRRVVLGAAGAGLVTAARAQAPIELQYWQYFFKERVAAMDELIRRFEAANPGVTVKQTTFPYAQYRTKVGAAVPAGQGPDVLQLYYGWLREYRRAGLIQPLPADQFAPAAIDRDFLPIIGQMQADGAYWALPTAVRSMGLFVNTKLLREAGLAVPPVTLDAFTEAARAIAKRDSADNLLQAGTTIGLPSQDSHWWREVLVRQFGGQPYSADGRTVTYGTDEGAAALRWYTDLQTKEHVAAVGFMSEPAAAFRAGRVGLHVNASFLVGALQAARGLEWGTAPLPTHHAIAANYASYWANAVVSGRIGAQRDAALRFLSFISSDAAMPVWLEATGELPGRRAASQAPALLADPRYGPLARGLPAAVATDFVDEDAQRAVFVDMLDRVLLQGQDTLTAVKDAAAAEQRIIDAYYAQR